MFLKVMFVTCTLYSQKTYHMPVKMCNEDPSNIQYIFSSTSILFSIKNTENSIEKTKQKFKNKIMHMISGNRKNNNKKQKKCIKIMQLNTGNGKFETTRDQVLKTIKDNKSDISVISESNMKYNEPDLQTDFKDFNFENKFMGTLETSRISLIINKEIPYTCMQEL